MDRGSAASSGAATVPRPVRGQRVAGAEDRARARLDGGPGGGRAHRRRVPPDPNRRATHALGLVLSTRHALLQLAARARAARGARLRGRARALSPPRPEPLGTVLGPRRATSPVLAPAARLAAGSRARASGVPSSRLIRRARCRRATAGYLTPRCSVEANRCTARTSEPPTSIIAIFVARTPSAAHDVASSPMPAATPR